MRRHKFWFTELFFIWWMKAEVVGSCACSVEKVGSIDGFGEEKCAAEAMLAS